MKCFFSVLSLSKTFGQLQLKGFAALQCYRYQKGDRGNVANHKRGLSRGHAQL
jgi:hypothetical protein